jgi:hypothetical protein
MTVNLLLDSSLAKRQRNSHNQKSHDFTIYFNPPIELDQEKNYKAALNRLITMSYSWYNIAEAYGNNKIKWRKNTGAWQTLTFPDGMYDYDGIKRFLQSKTGFVDPNDESKGRVFDLYFDFTIYRVVILMAKDYELDFTDGKFASLIGYGKKVYKDETNLTGEMLPDITRSVDWIFLHCDLISRRANDVESDVLYSFSTTGLQVSYPFKIEPRRLEFHPVSKNLIHSVRVWVTDGRNNILDLNGLDVALSVMVKEENNFVLDV